MRHWLFMVLLGLPWGVWAEVEPPVGEPDSKPVFSVDTAFGFDTMDRQSLDGSLRWALTDRLGVALAGGYARTDSDPFRHDPAIENGHEEGWALRLGLPFLLVEREVDRIRLIPWIGYNFSTQVYIKEELNSNGEPYVKSRSQEPRITWEGRLDLEFEHFLDGSQWFSLGGAVGARFGKTKYSSNGETYQEESGDYLFTRNGVSQRSIGSARVGLFIRAYLF